MSFFIFVVINQALDHHTNACQTRNAFVGLEHFHPWRRLKNVDVRLIFEREFFQCREMNQRIFVNERSVGLKLKH